jgi:uncharacterized GH25 family protein
MGRCCAARESVDQVVEPTGLVLVAEVVPDSDFTRARRGDAVGVRLLYEGKAVKNTQTTITWAAAMQSKARMTRARTDPEGRALLTLVGKGPYLLAAVGMIRRAGENGPEAADWESYWCSLTFDLASAKSLPQDQKESVKS